MNRFTHIMLTTLTAGFLLLEAQAKTQAQPRSREELLHIVKQMRDLSAEQAQELEAATAANIDLLLAKGRAEEAMKDALQQTVNLTHRIESMRQWGINQQAAKDAALATLADRETQLLREKAAHDKTRGSYLRLKTIAAIVIGLAIGIALLQFAPMFGPYGFLLPAGAGVAAAAATFFLL